MSVQSEWPDWDVGESKMNAKKMSTTSGVPRQSSIQLLTLPNVA